MAKSLQDRIAEAQAAMSVLTGERDRLVREIADLDQERAKKQAVVDEINTQLGFGKRHRVAPRTMGETATKLVSAMQPNQTYTFKQLKELTGEENIYNPIQQAIALNRIVKSGNNAYRLAEDMAVAQ